jgi:hypothetical protein
MLRLPPKHAPLSYGPELAGVGPTSIGLRSALVTERGVLGLVLAPEAGLRVESIALSVAIAVPIRFALDQKPTVGEFENAGDYLRFLRGASLGLRGADIDLRLTRFGDGSLLGGMVVDKLAPGSGALGVPGLTVSRSPLSLFGAVRAGGLSLEAITDDVTDPAVLGASGKLPLLGDLLSGGIAVATDQRAVFVPAGLGLRRAITAYEGELTLGVVDSHAWTVDFGAGAAVLSALAHTGYGARLTASAEYRFARGASSIGLDAHGGRLGANYLGAVFGPTYVAHKAAALDAIDVAGGRWLAGGAAHVRLGRVAIGAAYEDGAGEGRHALDRSVAAVLDLGGISLGDTRVLSLRVAWASRGLFEERTEHVVHAGARLRLAAWAHAELYVERGDRLEGGGGLTVSFAP